MHKLKCACFSTRARWMEGARARVRGSVCDVTVKRELVGGSARSMHMHTCSIASISSCINVSTSKAAV